MLRRRGEHLVPAEIMPESSKYPSIAPIETGKGGVVTSGTSTTISSTAELTDRSLCALTGHKNLNLTSEEKRLFYQLFQAADTTNLGVVTGEVAVPFFEKTKLPPDTLGLVCSALILGKRMSRNHSE